MKNKEQTKQQEELKTLKDVYNYINKHYWFIGDCRTQKAQLKYYTKVLLKIKEDLDNVFENTEKDFKTGIIK